MYEITIPASIDTEITSVQITLEPNDDELIEDDEFATLTLVEVVSGDPQVHLSHDRDARFRTRSRSTMTTLAWFRSSRMWLTAAIRKRPKRLRKAGTTASSFCSSGTEPAQPTVTPKHFVPFTVTLPTGLDPNSNPANGQANPLNDYTLTGADLVSWNPATGMGTVRIPAFTSMTMLNVVVIDDVLNESLEDVTITLNPNPVSNADIQDGHHDGSGNCHDCRQRRRNLRRKSRSCETAGNRATSRRKTVCSRSSLVDSNGNPRRSSQLAVRPIMRAFGLSTRLASQPIRQWSIVTTLPPQASW